MSLLSTQNHQHVVTIKTPLHLYGCIAVVVALYHALPHRSIVQKVQVSCTTTSLAKHSAIKVAHLTEISTYHKIW